MTSWIRWVKLDTSPLLIWLKVTGKSWLQMRMAKDSIYHPKRTVSNKRNVIWSLWDTCNISANDVSSHQGMHKFASAYLDNLIVFSSTWEDHLTHLKAVLSRLQELGLTTKPSKCQFGMTECTYLGYVIGNDVLKSEDSKL